MIRPISFPTISRILDHVNSCLGGIIRVAIQTIFITGVILAAASSLPIRFQAITLPIVAFSTTLFAAQCYM